MKFLHVQESLGLKRGTIKATVLVETILATFEMDEILYELREHSSGLNCGRWDYIFNLMEDAATAEISRAQLWQWIHHKAHLNDGREINLELCLKMIDEELAKIRQSVGDEQFRAARHSEAAEILRDLIQSARFVDFLTLPAYERLDAMKQVSVGRKS